MQGVFQRGLKTRKRVMTAPSKRAEDTTGQEEEEEEEEERPLNNEPLRLTAGFLCGWSAPGPANEEKMERASIVPYPHFYRLSLISFFLIVWRSGILLFLTIQVSGLFFLFLRARERARSWLRIGVHIEAYELYERFHQRHMCKSHLRALIPLYLASMLNT